MKENERNITAYILAGGKSSRMAEDKGLMLLNGKPMIAHIIDTIRNIFQEVIIISNKTEYSQFGLENIDDVEPQLGPAGGIMTGLAHSKTEVNFFISCDIPLISQKEILKIINWQSESHVLLAKSGNKLQPLCAVYKKGCYEVFRKNLSEGEKKLLTIVNQIHHEIIELVINPDYDPFFNVNNRKEHQQIEIYLKNAINN